MKSTYLDNLLKECRLLAEDKYAGDMARYMRNQFVFLGLRSPVRDRLFKDHISKFGLPKYEETKEMVKYLWELPEREFQYIAMSFLIKSKKYYLEEDINLFEKLIVTKPWWDTVDGLASWVAGTYFIRYPHQIKSVTRLWMDYGNIWLQRTSLLFQLKYKEKTDEDILFTYIRELSGSKEFFIQKAIGWALREYSKSFPEKIREFVKTHTLSNLSTREALKVINRKK